MILCLKYDFQYLWWGLYHQKISNNRKKYFVLQRNPVGMNWKCRGAKYIFGRVGCFYQNLLYIYNNAHFTVSTYLNKLKLKEEVPGMNIPPWVGLICFRNIVNSVQQSSYHDNLENQRLQQWLYRFHSISATYGVLWRTLVKSQNAVRIEVVNHLTIPVCKLLIM